MERYGYSLMINLIQNDISKCVGCNHCIRVCPIESANVARKENGKNFVSINPENCIHCGACLKACKHNSRYYTDDTEEFFNDLKQGVKISIIIAPAARTNLSFDFHRLITLLRKLGAEVIYDVSLGADICTWAHIRYVQKNNPPCLITQPCPVIVSYITKYNTDLLRYLSPVHSPMLCTALYMKKYKNIDTKIAAISPCVAKKDELDDTGIVSYNITFRLLEQYMKNNNIELPTEKSDFDSIDASLGQIYPMPGGLKENIEFHLKNKVRVDKSEGQHIVYKKLDELAEQPEDTLPKIFDVLNCEAGCNFGTGSDSNSSYFKTNKIMNDLKVKAADEYNNSGSLDLFAAFDKNLSIDSFLRTYIVKKVTETTINEQDIEEAFVKMEKASQEKRIFNCGACGSENCYDMAVKIAKGYNVPENCIEKARIDLENMHTTINRKYSENIETSNCMLELVTDVSSKTIAFQPYLEKIQNSGNQLEKISKQINKIIMQLNLLSLNATIEAARAGRAGAAFSVVAGEIGNLSKDTEAQIKDTAAIIDAYKQITDKTATFVCSISESMNELNNHAVHLKDTVEE